MSGKAPREKLPAGLRWRMPAALAVLWAERLGLAFWPAVSLAAAFVAAALIGLPAVFPGILRVVFVLGGLGGLALLAWRGFSAFAAPGERDAERRLERDSGLLHRPFAVLRDRPAGGGASAETLWRLHQARAASAIASLRFRGPDPLLTAHDPFALRAAASLALIAGLAIAGPTAGSRLASLATLGFAGWRSAPPPIVQAWIQPPAYTGLPPIFLPSEGAASAPASTSKMGQIEVPANSRVTISVTGLTVRPTLSMAGTSHRMEAIGSDSFQAALTLTRSGRLSLDTFWSDLAGWDISLLPNEPPVVAWTAPPGRAGTSLATKFPWHVEQRWGVAALQVELQPSGRPDLPSLAVKLPLPGTPKRASGAATEDLAANPFAGERMTARLSARDVSGQPGVSTTAEFVLPARSFRHPLARAIADLRRRLALHPGTEADAAADLGALAEAPFGPGDPSGLRQSAVVLNLAAAASLLTRAPHPGGAAVAEAQARLWTLALALDGALPDAAARALAEARERLREGMEDRANGKLSQRELSERLDALREALDKRLAEIGKQAMQRGAIEKFDPQRQHLSSGALDRLMRRMEQTAREGRMADAKRQMAELEKMLDQLKNAHVMNKDEMRQAQEQAKRGRQMLGAVQDMVHRETGLLDHAQSRAPAAPPGLAAPLHNFDFPPLVDKEPDEPAPSFGGMPSQEIPDSEPQQGAQPGGAAPPETGHAENSLQSWQSPLKPDHEPTASAGRQDARTQRALHRALDALSQGFVESGGQKPKNLDDAGRAMDDAAQALREGDDPLARDAIGRAIADLQQGGQNMARQMSANSAGQMQLSLQPGGQAGENGSGQDGEDEPDDGQGGRKKDPFGRQVDGNGTAADDPTLRVPDDMEQGRSRAIQDELRRRGADRQRPQQELDYIDRLLKPF